MASLQFNERRIHARQPVRFAYLDLGEAGAGAVMDLSEGGLAVQGAFRFNERSLPMLRFRFSDLDPWIEATGRLAWLSKSKKLAGIQFLNLSEMVRSKIRQWLYSAATVEAAIQVAVPAEPLAVPTYSEDAFENHFEELEPSMFRSDAWVGGTSHQSSGLVFLLCAIALVSCAGLFFVLRLGVVHWGDSFSATAPPAVVQEPSQDLTPPQSDQSKAAPALATPPRNVAGTIKTEGLASPSRAVQTRPDPAGASDTRFLLQVGAMRQKENADALASTLRQKSFPAVESQSAANNFYIVSVGPFNDRDSADQAIVSLKRQGFDVIVRRQPAP